MSDGTVIRSQQTTKTTDANFLFGKPQQAGNVNLLSLSGDKAPAPKDSALAGVDMAPIFNEHSVMSSLKSVSGCANPNSDYAKMLGGFAIIDGHNNAKTVADNRFFSAVDSGVGLNNLSHDASNPPPEKKKTAA